MHLLLSLLLPKWLLCPSFKYSAAVPARGREKRRARTKSHAVLWPERLYRSRSRRGSTRPRGWPRAGTAEAGTWSGRRAPFRRRTGRWCRAPVTTRPCCTWSSRSPSSGPSSLGQSTGHLLPGAASAGGTWKHPRWRAHGSPAPCPLRELTGLRSYPHRRMAVTQARTREGLLSSCPRVYHP